MRRLHSCTPAVPPPDCLYASYVIGLARLPSRSSDGSLIGPSELAAVLPRFPPVTAAAATEASYAAALLRT
ncbi:hypothetical protein cyc_01467 [Cyclospora cayetanensis]|uniref:Uncharacterized protein n=1 Tax=Cyclospora cayetanensis TaxID=88456 RepID=A0A1D3CR26_9EIME|nr:hypothetical protein cyc_01467 [Cyclospora cayetanensis]